MSAKANSSAVDRVDEGLTQVPDTREEWGGLVFMANSSMANVI
jgi:hypothetical protein